MKTSRFLCCFLLSLGMLPSLRAQIPDLRETPRFIQSLAVELRGRPVTEMRAVVFAKMGPAHRLAGSGIQREEWDVAEGVLTAFPRNPGIPHFKATKTGKMYFLVEVTTTNPVGANLVGRYDMITWPNLNNHGNIFRLGTLELAEDKTYAFKDVREERLSAYYGDQSGNFFLQHPKGTIELTYPISITAETLLETVANDEIVARLEFLSDDRQHRAAFVLTFSQAGGGIGSLSFAADGPLPFTMGKAWNDLGRNHAAFR